MRFFFHHWISHMFSSQVISSTTDFTCRQCSKKNLYIAIEGLLIWWISLLFTTWLVGGMKIECQEVKSRIDLILLQSNWLIQEYVDFQIHNMAVSDIR